MSGLWRSLVLWFGGVLWMWGWEVGPVVWWRVNHPYYRAKVVEPGLYRVDYATLQALGIPVSQIDASQYRVYYLGKPLWLFVGNDQEERVGVLQPGDYIEFYVPRANYLLDTALFVDPGDRPTRYVSYFNDTSYVYLTWESGVDTHRLDLVVTVSGAHPAVEPYVYVEEVRAGRVRYHRGKPVTVGTYNFWSATYDESEGWYLFVSGVLNGVYDWTTTLNLVGVYSGGNAWIEVVLGGLASVTHSYEVLVNGNGVLSGTYSGWSVHVASGGFSSSWLTGSTVVRVRLNTGGVQQDRQGVASVRVLYPRRTDVPFVAEPGTRAYLEVGGGARHLRVQLQGYTAPPAVLHDLTARVRVVGMDSSGLTLFDLPGWSGGGQREVVFGQARRLVASSFQLVVFPDWLVEGVAPDYVVVSVEPWLSSGALSDLLAHRSSGVGGGFRVRSVHVGLLYDAYAYGMVLHPLAIRNFILHQVGRLKAQGFTRPLHVLLVGRSYSAERHEYFTRTEVPTFGAMAGDVLLASSYDSSCYFCPVAAIGRLVPTSEEELRAYVDKVIEHEEALSGVGGGLERMWWKNVLHLGGGKTVGEQQMLRNYLNQLKAIIEGPAFAGMVTSFFKSSPDPIEIVNTQKFDSLIREGVSIQTFLGHSSINSFDVYIDEPENYPNEGKYPVFFSGGCYSADIFRDGVTIAHRFMYTAGRGAVGFYGSPYLAFASAHYVIGRAWYLSFAKAPWRSVGEHWLEAYRYLSGQGLANSLLRWHLVTWVHHGDPGHFLTRDRLPDYVVDPVRTQVLNNPVSVYDDSLWVRVVVWNTGIGVEDTFTLLVSHRYPSGQSVVYRWRVGAPWLVDTFEVGIPLEGAISQGLNLLTVVVDADQEIPELEDVSNNQLQLTVLVGVEKVEPVYPYPWMRVDTAPVTLYAFTGSVLSSPGTYVVQIDTSPTFSSPLFREVELTGVYGLVKWTPEIPWLEGVTYFWRVRAGGDTVWSEQSFTYVGRGGGSGWRQQHPYEWYRSGRRVGLRQVGQSYRFVFSAANRSIAVKTANYWWNYWRRVNPVADNCDELFWLMDGSRMDNACCARWMGQHCCGWSAYNGLGGIQIFAIDTLTGEVLEGVDLLPAPPAGPDGWGDQWGEYHCPWDRGGDAGLDFVDVWILISQGGRIDTVASQQDFQQRIVQFLTNLPRRYYLGVVGIGGWHAPRPSLWSSSLRSVLQSLGFTAVDSLCDLCPFIFFTRLGDPGFEPVQIWGDTFDVLYWDTVLSGRWLSGYMESPVIGPAGRWHRLRWSVSGRDSESDTSWVSVYAIDRWGREYLVIPVLRGGDTSLSWLPAKDYPYLKLRWYVSDTVRGTPLQLRFWEVEYEPYPELVYNPMAHFRVAKDTVYYGEVYRLEVAVENASDFGTDTVVVDVVRVGGSGVDSQLLRLSAFGPKEIRVMRVEVGSEGYSGENVLFVQLNPYRSWLGGLVQPEAYSWNNLLYRSFYVRRDYRNPYVDVTFDGRHIFDGDYVSPTPEIEIVFRDDNPYLPLNDTSLFRIYLEYPDGSLRYMSFRDRDVAFYPARGGGGVNEARVVLRPRLEQDGLYTLIVQGSDRAGNQSGKFDYRISFRVEHKPMITHVFNYPNPFSRATRFVFVLTGSRVPDDLRIQIMTVSGRVVREITKEELGPIHIGTNITEFAWDGTDQWGQPLGNGVYFYRVIARIDGEDVERLPTEADRFFSSGLGKMYLVR